MGIGRVGARPGVAVACLFLTIYSILSLWALGAKEVKLWDVVHDQTVSKKHRS